MVDRQWKVLALLTLGFLSQAVLGAQIYKYKDANGKWVMTDKPPMGGVAAEVETSRLVYTERAQKIAVVNRGSRQRPALYIVNQTAGPAQVWIEFTRQENLRFSQPGPYEWVVPAFAEQLVLQLQPAEANRTWAYEWIYRSVPGEPVRLADVGQPELGLPFRGGPFLISQGFMGEASHKQHKEAHFAVDIPMPDGTPIVAVKAGVVMEVERNFSRSGWSEEYADEANYVRLLHEDETMSVYAHLAPDKVEVVAGQSVRRGQLLGYSGSTGFSTGPHLHFVLQANGGRELVSVPFRFQGFKRPPQVGDRLQQP
jgi:murein DD-endopeptidase MepM/ murein hydrolase activator NlpD